MNYAITTPVFDKISIELDSQFYPGKKFEIVRHKRGEGNFIKSKKLNGESLQSFFINHDEVVKGARLEISTGNK